MTDIVERLQRTADAFSDDLAQEAADEIERLRAALAGAVEMTKRSSDEIDRLETALATARDDALDEAAKAAVGPVFEMNTRTGEPRYHGTEERNWSVPQPIAGFRGDPYGTGRYDAAKAIRALKSQPAPKRMTIEEWEEWLREASKDGPTPALREAFKAYRKHSEGLC